MSQFDRGARRAHEGVACICIALLLAAPARADLLAEAGALLEAGRPDRAVALLEPHERARAGESAFDALFGAALLQDGQAARASLALERATASDPRLAGARLDLAIAYYRMGSYAEARHAFLAVRALDPPPPAARVVEEHLARLESASAQRRLSFDLALGGGYDGNANSATALTEFLGFTLTETSRAVESAYYELAGSAGWLQPAPRGVALEVQANLRQRMNPEAGFVDATGAELLVGLRQERARAARSAGLLAYRLDADGELNSRGAGVAARYRHALRERLSLSAFARAVAIRYGDSLSVKDVDALAGGVELRHAWGPARRGGLRLEALVGHDRPRHGDSPYGRSLYGLEAVASWAFSADLRGQLGAGWLRSEYEEAFFPTVLAEARTDSLAELRAASYWQCTPAWELEAQLSFARNDTNVAVFEYERLAFGLTARRRWR